ncbi:hypothetical protein [Sinorhizobium psoraleae]|uniref:hypothetical protein n=1 Tax=Sinorhizobium psoraleae TaxID=520838 RepID=UPI001568E873|nr:hypothetical protein [Sinorhizobium psoraleae]
MLHKYASFAEAHGDEYTSASRMNASRHTTDSDAYGFTRRLLRRETAAGPAIGSSDRAVRHVEAECELRRRRTISFLAGS